MGSAQSAQGTGEGSKIGNYTVEKTLGKGSFAEVKLGRHPKTGEKVALKLIDKSSISKGRRKIHLQREIRFLKLLNHPNIGMLYEVIETDASIVLIMEHASGGELLNYIRRSEMHRLKEKEARRLFRQIVSAVDYCHQNSLIHRDIKPENILLDKDMNVKIIDFGFSNTFQDGMLLDSFIGSPHYAAPELLQGIKYTGPEVDMWSLGVLLYVMICGRLPFKDPDMRVLYDKVKSGRIEYPLFISPESKELISLLLVVDPTKRATMETVKKHPWVMEGYSVPIDSGCPPRPPIVDIDHDVFSRLVKFYGYDKDEARVSLLSDKKNPTQNIYYLLWENMNRDKASSHSDNREVSTSGGVRSKFTSLAQRLSQRKKDKQKKKEEDKEAPGKTSTGKGNGDADSVHSSTPSAPSTATNSPIPVRPSSAPPDHAANVAASCSPPSESSATSSPAPEASANGHPAPVYMVKNLETGELMPLSQVEDNVRRLIHRRHSQQYAAQYGFVRHPTTQGEPSKEEHRSSSPEFDEKDAL